MSSALLGRLRGDACSGAPAWISGGLFRILCASGHHFAWLMFSDCLPAGRNPTLTALIWAALIFFGTEGNQQDHCSRVALLAGECQQGLKLVSGKSAGNTPELIRWCCTVELDCSSSNSLYCNITVFSSNHICSYMVHSMPSLVAWSVNEHLGTIKHARTREVCEQVWVSVCWQQPCSLLKNSLQRKDVSGCLFLRAHPCMARGGRAVREMSPGYGYRHKAAPQEEPSVSAPVSSQSKYNYNDITANAPRKLAGTSDQRDVWERRWAPAELSRVVFTSHVQL